MPSSVEETGSCKRKVAFFLTNLSSVEENGSWKRKMAFFRRKPTANCKQVEIWPHFCVHPDHVCTHTHMLTY